MKKQRGFVEIIGTIVITLIMLFFWAVFASWSCSSKWEQSGMRVSWGPVKGCLVQIPSGRWMPEERIREMDLTPRENKGTTGGGESRG